MSYAKLEILYFFAGIAGIVLLCNIGQNQKVTFHSFTTQLIEDECRTLYQKDRVKFDTLRNLFYTEPR